MPETNSAEDSLRTWSAVAPAWDRYRDRLFEDVRSVSEWLVDQVDRQPGQTVLEPTADAGETGFLAAARLGSTGRLISSDFAPTGGGFTDVAVEELTGTTRFDGPDDYWTHITEVAGPVAELAGSLDGDQVKAIRSTLDPSLAQFERDGALEIPWLAVVTSAG
jgi:hypothetical protein